jgi:hypothetical protein
MNTTSATHHSQSDSSDSGSQSRCHVALLSGSSVTFWTCPQTDVAVQTAVHGVPDSFTELALCLAPEKLVVVGRASPHHTVPYLDPAYRSTTFLPDSNQSVLHGGNDESDTWVSRAHFTLRGADGGAVVFTNGVPKLGGGIRPPMNDTWLVAPAVRLLGPGEEVLIDCGEAVSIRLPNRCVLQLKAR